MLFTARWLLPIDRSPIRDAWLAVDSGQIVAFGDGAPPAGATPLGDVALLPGLVNAHTHLELSWMAGLVPPASSMNAWIHSMLKIRRGQPVDQETDDRAAREAAAAMRAGGIVLVGDISNGLRTPASLASAGLGGVVFHELLGFT